MTISICPNCGERILHEKDSCDFVHECNSGINAVDNEDILVVGDWEDYSGSGTENNVLLQGSTNKFWGTRAQLEGEDLEKLTPRGNSTELYRTRKHNHFINLNGGK